MKPALIAAIMLACVVYLAPWGQGEEGSKKPQTETSYELSLSGIQIHSYAEESAPDDQTPHWYESPEWVLVIVGLITAFVIGWQSYETRRSADAARTSVAEIQKQALIVERQTRAMEATASSAAKSLTLASDTAQKQLRAYVCLTRAEMKIGPRFIRVRIHTKNFGQTPAYNVRQWIHQWITDYPLKEVLPEPPDNFLMSSSILGPGDHHIMPAGWEDLPSNLVVGTSEQTVYIYGKVVYADVFGHSRFTKYRLVLGPRQLEGQRPIGTSGVVDVLLSPDTEGNEQD